MSTIERVYTWVSVHLEVPRLDIGRSVRAKAAFHDELMFLVHFVQGQRKHFEIGGFSRNRVSVTVAETYSATEKGPAKW